MEYPIDRLVEWFAESNRISETLDEARQRAVEEAARGAGGQ